jgi:hypothetical protein
MRVGHEPHDGAALPFGELTMPLHFFAEFPRGCDSRAVDAALELVENVFDALWVPKAEESDPDAIAISVHTREDPVAIVQGLIELFEVLERRFKAVIFEMHTGRRYGPRRVRTPLN